MSSYHVQIGVYVTIDFTIEATDATKAEEIAINECNGLSLGSVDHFDVSEYGINIEDVNTNEVYEL